MDRGKVEWEYNSTRIEMTGQKKSSAQKGQDHAFGPGAILSRFFDDSLLTLVI